MISASSVADIFKQHGIKAVAIIDDDFDDPGLSMSASLTASLFNDLSASPEMSAAFARAGHRLDSIDDLTPSAIAKVRAAKQDQHAQDAWSQVKVAAQGRRLLLDALASNLKTDLKLKVKKIGASSLRTTSRTRNKDVVDDAVDIVFLDYELREGDEQGALSAEITERIHSQFAGKNNAPLVILMSSKALDELAVANFQRGTKVLSGMFYFVQKADLFDQEKRHYRLAAFAKSLATGRVLQRFVTGLETSIESIRTKVFADVRSLSIADYAFLQKLRLNEDGQPLGEYLLWLTNAHLTKELLCSPAVKAAEAEVNKLTFDDLPPTQSSPSISLATLYSSAVMRPMQPLPEAPENQATFLQFGDLFRKKTGKQWGKQVWLCITAPCDLAFGPKRQIPSRRSVLFLPGTLQPIGQSMKPFEQRQPRTELVRLPDNRVYRIIWNTKEIARTEWGTIDAWKKSVSAERIARLNTPFALEIQRAFATDLTRVGMPTPPPFYNPVKVRLTVADAMGKDIELTNNSRCDGYLTSDDRNTRLVLGEGFMNALPEMLQKAEATLNAKVAILNEKRDKKEVDPGTVKNAEEARDKVKAARQDAEVLSSIKGPFDVPDASRAESLLQELMVIIGDPDMSSSQSHVPLRLAILPIEDPEEAGQAA